MIKVDGQLCYSPFPMERYATGNAGLGVSCRQDVQLWNLVYLSCEGIEDHLDPSSGAYALDLARRDRDAFAVSHAALYGANCQELFPRLRDALKKHPSEFLRELWRMPWEDLPASQRFHDWDNIVIGKVAHIAATFSVSLSTLVPGLSGNFFGDLPSSKFQGKVDGSQ